MSKILTTHAGSLPRPPSLAHLFVEKEQGKTIDEKAFEAEIDRAVADSMRHQVECGLDIIGFQATNITAFTNPPVITFSNGVQLSQSMHITGVSEFGANCPSAIWCQASGQDGLRLQGSKKMLQ